MEVDCPRDRSLEWPRRIEPITRSTYAFYQGDRGAVMTSGTPIASTRPRAAKNMQLMTEGEVLSFRNCPTTESAGKHGDDGSLELMHAGDTTAVILKTLDSSPLSEFSVGIGTLVAIPMRRRLSPAHRNHQPICAD